MPAVTFALDVGTGGVVKAFLQERVFPRHQWCTLQLAEEEEQEQAQESNKYAEFLNARNGKT